MSFLAEKLRRQTSELANLLTRRINDLKDREGLASFIRSLSKSRNGASFFEPGDYYAVGIDGSMDYDEVLEMLLFYVCATGFRCKFTVNDEIKFSLDEVVRDGSRPQRRFRYGSRISTMSLRNPTQPNMTLPERLSAYHTRS